MMSVWQKRQVSLSLWLCSEVWLCLVLASTQISKGHRFACGLCRFCLAVVKCLDSFGTGQTKWTALWSLNNSPQSFLNQSRSHVQWPFCIVRFIQICEVQRWVWHGTSSCDVWHVTTAVIQLQQITAAGLTRGNGMMAMAMTTIWLRPQWQLRRWQEWTMTRGYSCKTTRTMTKVIMFVLEFTRQVRSGDHNGWMGANQVQTR